MRTPISGRQRVARFFSDHRTHCLILVLAVVFPLFGSAHRLEASTLAIESFFVTEPGDIRSFTPGPTTYGWEIALKNDFTLESLGIWDDGADGLDVPHQVGIWSGNGQTLLGSVTVKSGTASPAQGPNILGGVFRFEPLEPKLILDKPNYIIGALFSGSDSFAVEANVTLDSAAPFFIDWANRGPDNAGFVAPTIDNTSNSTNPGLVIGPNLTFDAEQLATARAGLDIKPRVEHNPVNLKSRGALKVAVHSTDVFDALAVDVETILFGDPDLLDNGATGVQPIRSHERDVNGDGLADLLLKFNIRDLVKGGALDKTTTEAILTGLTPEGTPFERFDSIQIVGKSRKHQRHRHRRDRHDSPSFEYGGLWANNFSLGPPALDGSLAAVPEPSTFLLSGIGVIGLLGFGRRRRAAM